MPVLSSVSSSVDMNTGRPCLDLLDDYDIWKEAYSIEAILLALQVSAI